MRILHTSDWHLGRQLHQKPRDDEFAAFLAWLPTTLEEEEADVLVIAGDVFDSANPGHRAQQQYFDVLKAVRHGRCRHVIVVAGNHDAPGLVDAPAGLLGDLDVHVVGSPLGDPDDCVRVLRAPSGEARLIVCAIPYLRDRDLLVGRAGETSMDREQRLREGIRAYYAQAAERAAFLRSVEGGHLPVLATGHLMATGGLFGEDDGVRDLYVGGLGAVDAEAFSGVFDYVALGHLHRAQSVGGTDRIRYSGAPLAMGFGESGLPRTVTVVDLEPGRVAIRERHVPQVRRLVRLGGDYADLAAACMKLRDEGNLQPAWVEVTYRGSELRPELRDELEALLEGSAHEILRLRDRLIAGMASSADFDGNLEEFGVEEVFSQLLDLRETTDAERPDLLATFREMLHDVQQETGR